MWIRPRQIVARWLGQDPPEPEVEEPSAPAPTFCSVCGGEDHSHEHCPAVITLQDLRGRAGWFPGDGDPERSSGEGETFTAIRALFRRISGR